MPSHLVEKSHKLLQNLGASSEYAKSSKRLTKSKNLKSLPYIWDTKNRLTLLSLKGAAIYVDANFHMLVHIRISLRFGLYLLRRGRILFGFQLFYVFHYPSPPWQTPSFVPQPYAYISCSCTKHAHASKPLGCCVAKWLARLPACRKGSILSQALAEWQWRG